MTSLKRKATDEGSDFESEASTPASSKRRITSGVEKVAKKAARMERNRQAAQVSRDRKKQYVQELEAKIAELQAQSPAAAAVSPPPVDPAHIASLESENASLRARLASETAERQTLQTRLGSLEAQMQAITALLSSQTSSSSTCSTPTAAAYPYEAVSPLVLSDSLAPLDPHPLVAREHSLQRNRGSMQASLCRPIPSRRPLAPRNLLRSTTRSSGALLSGPKSSWTPLRSSPPRTSIPLLPPNLRISISRPSSKVPKTRFSLTVLPSNGKRR